ncbi:MAG: methionyl-tRNA formyltransferase [Halobacteriovoraceae bacterium]|nr:methionyl-tRNA formyltransferase [Halobacteriovoraceae bacterium]|tara:strand:- start:27689 stop:28615 length:927 start_codon:yes stop_codon:yes gene_type:complete
MKKLRVVYFGTPDFSVPSLDLLANHPCVDLKFVVSMPDRKAGRGYQLKSPEVIEYAKEKKIPYFQTSNINLEKDFLTQLADVDVFIVLAFAQFLSESVLSLPAKGAFNIHTSLLPKYRGAAPIQYALLNGDQETGVSIQKMVKKMDAGDIGHSHSVRISSYETGGQLYTKLKYQAALALNDFLDKILNNNIQYESQDESLVSFAPTLKREDGKLEFSQKTFVEINNQVRALYPWPGTYCLLNDKRLKVFGIEKSSFKVSPGEVQTKNGELIIGLRDCAIRLIDIQLEGKKRSSDRELLNGLKTEIKIN